MRKVLLVVALVMLAAPAAAADKVIVDINNPSTQKISVAVPPLLAGPGVSQAIVEKVADNLAWNLDFSGVFKTVDSKAWLADPAKDTLAEPQYKAWYDSGAISLIRGEVKKTATGYSIEMRYYDTVQGKPLALPGGSIGKVYTVGSDPAPAAHAFANLLMELITQRSGPFGSRLVYEYRKPKTTRKDLSVVDLGGKNHLAVTKNNLLNLSPSFSPDGTKIVYTSYKRRNPDLYVMNVATGSDEALSVRPGTNSGGVFSPDGKTVAASLSFDGDSEIYLLDLKGNIAAKLTNSGAIDVQPTFSPDGKQLAFTSDRIGNPNVFLMKSDGSNVHRLTVTGKYNSSPAWSPTGEWIAYYSRDDANIWLIKPDGSETKQLTFGEGSNEDPAWSPDGRYVVFSSNRSGTFNSGSRYRFANDNAAHRPPWR